MNLAFDLSAVAMVLFDESLRIVQANPAAAGMLGSSDLVGRLATGLSIAANVERAEQENASWLNGTLTHLERETDLLGKAGETLRAVVRVDTVALPSGRRYFLTQLRDVTAQRQQERALAASEAQYRQLAENLPGSSVMLFDHDLRLRVAAGEALSANGYASDLAGELMWDVFPAAGMELLESHFRAALAGRATDFAYTSPVGGRIYRARARPVFDSAGDVVGGLSVMEDVTEDRARALQLEQVEQIGRFGGCTYDRLSGWAYDDALLALWGIEDASIPDCRWPC